MAARLAFPTHAGFETLLKALSSVMVAPSASLKWVGAKDELDLGGVSSKILGLLVS
jgi:hypothetical protein